ncbi:MAG: hypothetical protein WKF84_22820 [Pyrinomonadaceae bacterium]
MMNIGVDATCWQNNRGYGRYARALLTHLVALDKQNQYTFFMDSAESVGTVPSQVQVKTISVDAPTVVAARSDGHRSASDMWRMSRCFIERATRCIAVSDRVQLCTGAQPREKDCHYP